MSSNWIAGTIVTIFLTCSEAAIAQQDIKAAYADVLNEPATDDAITNATEKLSQRGCDDACHAFLDVTNAFSILPHLHLTNSMARIKPLKVDPHKKAEADLRNGILSHPERNPFYCEILTKFASHYSDWDIGFYSIELSTRISKPPVFNCTSAVIAALPRNDETRHLVQQSREVCESDRKKSCELIIGF